MSNVFQSEFVFDKEIPNVDFFHVDGIHSKNDRFRLLGFAVEEMQRKEKSRFAQYTPSPSENYIIGFLNANPFSNRYSIEGLEIAYEGKRSLPPTPSSKRALTSLLNKIRFNELRKDFWSTGGHFFYSKKGFDLNEVYPNCDLTLFRGPFYRYNILNNGRIILSLDSSTHYVSSKPIFAELRSRGSDGLNWLRLQIDSRKKQLESGRRTFSGLHFFYELYQNDVVIDDVDPRPIKEIPFPKPIVVNDVECKTVYEYLLRRYSNHPKIRTLDPTQPGLKGGDFTYPPQFLYPNISLEDVPDEILNDETFFADQMGAKYGDVQKPARVRWGIIEDYFERYGFGKIDSGSFSSKMTGPLSFSLSNRFPLPKLIAGDPEPVLPTQIEQSLRRGLYKRPEIDIVYVYSSMNQEYTSKFYEEMKAISKERYAVTLPHKFIPLEKDIQKMRAQLEKSLSAKTSQEKPFFIGIIPEGSDLYERITNICGELQIPSKCVTSYVAERICNGKRFYLRDTLASAFSRAGGIPWILNDKLHYDCYAAVDVGRALMEHWAMGIVYDRDGKFTIRPGRVNVGEDIDRQSMMHCISEASRYAPSSHSIIYLRDGDVFENEKTTFESVIEQFSRYTDAAIVSVKKSVPYRIFRGGGDDITKPQSGDYYFLDDNNAVLCSAGVDIYQHGMPKPIVAEVIPVRGNINPKYVVEDIFRLAFLNWGSPGRSYSVPAPIRLAHESAYELSMGIRRFGAPF